MLFVIQNSHSDQGPTQPYTDIENMEFEKGSSPWTQCSQWQQRRRVFLFCIEEYLSKLPIK